MKVIKVVSVLLYIIFLISLVILILIQREEIKYQDKMVNEKIMEKLPMAELYNEYYQNIMLLRESSECKLVADSIFNNSNILKDWDVRFNKQLEKSYKKTAHNKQ